LKFFVEKGAERKEQMAGFRYFFHIFVPSLPTKETTYTATEQYLFIYKT
jgi:hypothetical protein